MPAERSWYVALGCTIERKALGSKDLEEMTTEASGTVFRRVLELIGSCVRTGLHVHLSDTAREVSVYAPDHAEGGYALDFTAEPQRVSPIAIRARVRQRTRHGVLQVVVYLFPLAEVHRERRTRLARV